MLIFRYLPNLEGRNSTYSSPGTMLGPNPTDGAGAGAHDYAFGGHRPAPPALDAFEQRPVGNAGRGEDAVALREVVQLVDAIEVLDAPFAGTRLLGVVAEQQFAVELPADAAQRRRGEHAFG